MATTASVLNMLRNRVNLAVSKIGTTNGTQRPVGDNSTTDNKAGVAYELAIAQLINKRSAARYRKAVKDAIDAGVMFDHTAEPMPADTVRTLYSDDVVTVVVRTTTPHSRLNSNKLRELLIAGGLSFAEVDKLFKQATEKTKPPHEFTADIISADDALSLTNGK